MKQFIALHDTPEQILRLAAVIIMTGQCRTNIYIGIKENRFPRQRKLGKRSVGWSYLEIQAYVRITLAGGDYIAAK